MFLYSYEAEFIQSLLSAGKKQLASQYNFIYRYIDDVLSSIFQIFIMILVRCIPLSFRIKDTTESNTSAFYLDLLLSIGRDGQLRTSLYDKRNDFNFHITNYAFLSSNIRSSSAYYVFTSQHIRYARACSSLMSVLFWKRSDFHVNFSDRDMSGNVWNRPSGSSMVIKHYDSPSPKCYMTFWDMIIYSDTLHWPHLSLNRDIATELDLITDFDVITLFREVSIGHLQRVRLANRGRLLLRTPGPVPFRTCICSNVETILSWTCHVYGPFEFRTSIGTSTSPWIRKWNNSSK